MGIKIQFEKFCDKGSADYNQELTMIDQIKRNRSILVVRSNQCIQFFQYTRGYQQVLENTQK